MQNIYEEIIKYTFPLKVLFVEDNKEARDSFIILLEDFFCDIIIAVDGYDGIEKFKNNKIDLIITDIDMPNFNGLDMIQEIKNIEKNILVILLSAHKKPEYSLQSIKLNVDAHLVKPINLDDMLLALKKIIQVD